MVATEDKNKNLDVDNFHFMRKIMDKILVKKLVKLLGHCTF